MQSLDLALVNQLNNYANGSSMSGYTAIFFADYFQYVLGCILIGLFFSSRAWLKTVILAMISASVARLGVKTIILFFIQRARPFTATQDIHVLINTSFSEQYQSFPSGHALIFFAIAFTAYLHDKKWGLFFLVSAILMGIARVAVGVHYPSDIVAGAIIGILSATATVYISKKFH
jgi:undecaprenyl-diphosphatase